MAVIFCDSATGSDSDDGSTWALAKATLQAAITAAGAGGTVYLADTHSETPAANTTLTLPQTGNDPVVIITSDVLTGTSVSYVKASAAQFDVSGGSYDITLDGAGIFVGVYLKTGDDFLFSQTSAELLGFYDCTISPSGGNASAMVWNATADGSAVFDGVTFIISDTSSNSAALFAMSAGAELSLIFRNCTFSGTLTHRTGSIFDFPDNTRAVIEGTDFSGLANATLLCERDANTESQIRVDGCKLPAGMAIFNTAVFSDSVGTCIATRCDGNNYGILHDNYFGSTVDGDKTRDNGASDGDRHSWLVTTTAKCRVGYEYVTPWLPVWVSTTGSKTFTVYIANASADLTDSECWLEVEYLGTASSTKPTYLTDRNSDILAAGTAQTDDTTSDWDADITYMQSLAVTATVGKAGLQRCRVGFAKASATVYVDPTVTVG